MIVNKYKNKLTKSTSLAKTFINVTNVSQWNTETRKTAVQGKMSGTNLKPSWIKTTTTKRLSPALTKKEPALILKIFSMRKITKNLNKWKLLGPE